MSGTVFINEEVTWMPSEGTVTLLLELLSSQLETVNKGLSESLVDESKGIGWGVYDFRNLRQRQYNELVAAMEDVFITVMRAPSKYPDNNIFIFSLSLFKTLLSIDHRIQRDVSGTGRIVIQEGALWNAPTCMYDMVLEHFAAGIYRLHPDLAEWLLKAKVLDGTGLCDLRQLDSDNFHGLRPTIRHMALYYGATHGRSLAPAFFPELNARLSELKALLESDPRAGER